MVLEITFVTIKVLKDELHRFPRQPRGPSGDAEEEEPQTY